jgi:hypothetical protein
MNFGGDRQKCLGTAYIKKIRWLEFFPEFPFNKLNEESQQLTTFIQRFIPFMAWVQAPLPC